MRQTIRTYIFFTLIFSGIINNGYCQTEDQYIYEIVYDNPDTGNANLYINADIAGINYGFENSFSPYFFAGASGLYTFDEKKAGIEFAFKFPAYKKLILDEQDLPSTHFDIGGFYNFASKTKTKKFNLIVNSSFRNDYRGNVTVNEVIKVPATYKHLYGVRGGLIVNNTGWLKGATRSRELEEYIYQARSFYLGLSAMTIANVYIKYKKNDNGGVSEQNKKGWRTYYLDFIYTPSVILPDGKIISSTATSNYGFRIGQVYLNPLTRNQDPVKSWFPKIFLKYEVGYRRVEGWNFTVGFVYQAIRTKI